MCYNTYIFCDDLEVLVKYFIPTLQDIAESVKTMTVLKKEIKTPISYHAGGKYGRLSRVVNPALGGQIAFCVDRYNEGSTMEQIDLKTARTVIDGLKKIM